MCFCRRSLTTDAGFHINETVMAWFSSLFFFFFFDQLAKRRDFERYAERVDVSVTLSRRQKTKKYVQIKDADTLNLLPPCTASLFLCFPLHFQQVQTPSPQEMGSRLNSAASRRHRHSLSFSCVCVCVSAVKLKAPPKRH